MQTSHIRTIAALASGALLALASLTSNARGAYPN